MLLDAAGRAYLSDLGLALTLGTAGARTAAGCSRQFAAPELLLGERCTLAADMCVGWVAVLVVAGWSARGHSRCLRVRLKRVCYFCLAWHGAVRAHRPGHPTHHPEPFTTGRFSFGVLLMALTTQQLGRERGDWRLPTTPQEAPQVWGIVCGGGAGGPACIPPLTPPFKLCV